MVSYLAFDLDSTLVNLTTPVWTTLCILKQSSAAKLRKNMTLINQSNNYDWESAHAYETFVKKIAHQEMSSQPLGIIRPGIIKVMSEVVKKRQNGLCKGVIMYTNNSNEALVNFSRDLLEYIAKAKIFDDCLYVHHPLRAKRAVYPDMIKTWTVLKDLLVESVGAPQTLMPNNVLFYDDQPHVNLMSALGVNYIHVTPYNYSPRKNRIIDISIESFKGLLEPGLYEEFNLIVKACHPQMRATTKADMLVELRQLLGVTVQGPSKELPPSEDLSISVMLDSLKHLKKIENNSNNFFSPSKKGKTKRRRFKTKRSKY